MGTKQNIAVIDIGKTNAKVVLVDGQTLQEIAVETTPNRVITSAPYPHFDVDGIWSFILASLTNFQSRFGVFAISITAHGACGALLDDKGNLAAPILDYEYKGIEETAAEYERVRPAFEETGSPRLAGGLNLGAQIYWQFRTFPEVGKHTANIVMYPQYWAHRLTGVVANEVSSLGCHTDLWNPNTNDFSSMVEALGWRQKFAPVKPASNVLGPVLKNIAAQTGLPTNTPVYCGIHDSNASLYPYLLSQSEPFSVVSTGTWVIVMSVGGADVVLDEERDTLINVNALGNKVPSARFMGGREFELLRGGRGYEFNPDDLHSVLKDAVMLFPSVESSSGPFAGRQMHWTHDPSSLSEGEHAVAASFYLALMTLTCLELVGAQGNIFVEGSFCSNQAYLSMLQAMVDSPVSNAEGTGTSQGAALLVVGSQQHTVSSTVQTPSEFTDLMRSYGANWVNKLSTESAKR